jgi:hypothetical protein
VDLDGIEGLQCRVGVKRLAGFGFGGFVYTTVTGRLVVSVLAHLLSRISRDLFWGFVLEICSGAVKEILLLWSLQLGQLARLWGSGGWANPEN